MIPRLEKLLDKHFACRKDPYCDPRSPMIPHTLMCPATWKERARRVLEDALRLKLVTERKRR